jgi:hypothetical protein
MFDFHARLIHEDILNSESPAEREERECGTIPTDSEIVAAQDEAHDMATSKVDYFTHYPRTMFARY